MKRVVACGIAGLALALPGCMTAPRAGLPLNYGNGAGSEHGNYAAERDGETRGSSGERCVVFNWDRPLTQDLVVRLRSASCESREHPNWMTSTELARTVIPLSESNLRDAAAQPRP
ncbi:hypothetical protein [Azospirillum canadense]|uniref:hypothetical protein n=1 Tax=Azospirillum canadense TaxID=403962 RepID=UPI002225F075|nr:hypothetical protein [Azospirillum canadense]MCW2244199.1 hypothetical protein [Azospirillum canadense]